MTKKVCITGATGQVGSVLCERFLNEGYKVYGLKRRSSSFNTERLNHIFDNPNLKLIYGDITDSSSISNFVSDIKPDIFVNCAAQSHVRVSFDIPTATLEATGNSVLNCLEAIRLYSPNTRFITMSSSEMFGSNVDENRFQNEKTTFHPRSPYAVAKVAGYYATINYREAYNLHASNAICFNIEGPNRGPTFATRKITLGATRCKLGLQNKLYLGNLKSFRDWTYVGDTVDALYKMATTDKLSDDYVIASGQTHSIEEFCELVFKKLDLDYKDYVEFDPKYLRPTEVDWLCGDASKIRNILNWKPICSFDELIDIMVKSDLKLAEQEKLLKDNK